MSKAKSRDPLAKKFTLETMQGEGVRGKYFAKVSKGFEVVKLNSEVAKPRPSAAVVNAAHPSGLEITPATQAVVPAELLKLSRG